MAAAAYLVVPSTWYEVCPLVVQEAHAHGLPVIASDLGSLPEYVIDGHTGLLFTPGDGHALAAKVRWAETHRDAMLGMGEHARQDFEENGTPERNFDILMSIYDQVLAVQDTRISR